jgi:hypothetical protein
MGVVETCGTASDAVDVPGDLAIAVDWSNVDVRGCSISSRLLSQLIRPRKRVGDVCTLDKTAAALALGVELPLS